MNKEYLQYQIKSRKYLIVFLALVHVFVTIASFITNDLSLESKAQLSLGTNFACMMIAAITLTPFMFNFVNNKKAVDSYFSLPLSRKQLLLNTIIFLVLMIYGSWLIPSVISLLIGASYISFGWAMAYLLGMLMMLCALIAFYGTIFLLANNTLDGIIMIGAYLLLPLFLSIMVTAFQDIYIVGYYPFDLQIFGYLSVPFMVCNAFFEFVGKVFQYNLTGAFDVKFLDLLITAIFGIIFGITLYRSFISRKAERSEQNSDYFLAYPTVIYFYSFALLFMFTSYLSFSNHHRNLLEVIISGAFIYVAIFVFFMIAHFIYHRKIFINAKMVIFFVITIAASFALSEAAYQTKGFGLSYAYNKNHEMVNYNLYGTLDFKAKHREKIIDYIVDNYEQLPEGASKKETFDFLYVDIEIIESDPKSPTHELFNKLRNEAIDNYYSEQFGYYNGGYRMSINVFEYDFDNTKGEEERYSYQKDGIIDDELIDSLKNIDSVRFVVNGYFIPKEVLN